MAEERRRSVMSGLTGRRHTVAPLPQVSETTAEANMQKRSLKMERLMALCQMTKETNLLPVLLRALTLMLTVTSLCCGVTVIDLTHQLKERESITWPTNPRYNFSVLTRGHAPLCNNLWIENNEFEMAEHTGTHMDAPSHLRKTEGGWRMHQIPADRLVGPGVMVDIREKLKGNPVYSATVQDMKDWESEHGKIPEKAVVLLNAGWASRYPDWNRVFNTQNIQDPTTFKFPSVTAEAAAWLANERNIIALGVDTPTPDPSINQQQSVHEVLLEKSIMILENVANLNSLPPTGTTIVMGALNIHEGSGAPMRLLALSGCNAGWELQSCPLFTMAMGLGLLLLVRTRVL